MIITPHTTISLLIAKIIPNPFISAPISLFSHYILDLIPHEPEKDIVYPIPHSKTERKQDPEFKRRFWIISCVDSVFSLILVINFFNIHQITSFNNIFNYLIIIFFGILPDILNFIGMFFPNKLFHFFAGIHHKIHLLTGIFINRYVSIALQYFLSLLIYFFIII
jgi:hypothetical protein